MAGYRQKERWQRALQQVADFVRGDAIFCFKVTLVSAFTGLMISLIVGPTLLIFRGIGVAFCR